MVPTADVVIVGAGQAGAQVAISLRKGGYKGSIVLTGDEASAPYSRPPLSKEYLTGDSEPEGLFLRESDYWTSAGIDLRLSTGVREVDADRHLVDLGDGSMLRYHNLVLAAGGSARSLPVPGASLHGVRTIRSLADSAALKADLDHIARAVVVGGGYLGLEVASALRKLGVDVAVVEAQSALLNRTTSPVVSEFFLDLHRARGVEVYLCAVVEEIRGTDGGVSEVVLGSGQGLRADTVVVAIGMIANDGLLRAAGAWCEAGVLVDRRCRTSLPDVYAAGDCAMRVNEYGLPDLFVRLESVQNAIAQGKIVAADLLGQPYEPPSVPWFWSNQYETKLRSVGLNHGHDELLVEGDPSTGAFAVAYMRRDERVALDCVNTAAGFGQLKKTLEQRVMDEGMIKWRS